MAVGWIFLIINQLYWWRWVGSNHRPQGYESCALTGLSYIAMLTALRKSENYKELPLFCQTLNLK